MEDKLKQSEQAREQLAKELVRTKVSLEFADNTIKKQQENIRELKAENERLYEEKNCLHKIIDRLLDNAGYSKDIASAEDFEDVYENMQYNRQKLSEYKQTLQEIKKYIAKICKEECGYVPKKRCPDCDCRYGAIVDLITKAGSEG